MSANSQGRRNPTKIPDHPEGLGIDRYVNIAQVGLGILYDRAAAGSDEDTLRLRLLAEDIMELVNPTPLEVLCGPSKWS
jgi:hypothetical protein